MEFDPNSNPPCYKTVDEVRIFIISHYMMEIKIKKRSEYYTKVFSQINVHQIFSFFCLLHLLTLNELVKIQVIIVTLVLRRFFSGGKNGTKSMP